jgi:hypothetical protein
MMAVTANKWKATIKIGDLHARYQAGELPIVEVAKQLADRVEKYRDKTFQPDTVAWDELDDIIFWFRDDVQNVTDYDGVLDELYNWADEGRRLWVDKLAN